MQIENGFKNLLFDEDIPGSSLQERRPYLEEIETIQHAQDQIFTRMKRVRKDRKNFVRRKEIEKRITAGTDEDEDKVSILPNGEPSSSMSTDDTGRPPFTTRQQREHDRIIRYYGSFRGKRATFSKAGLNLDASHGSGVKAEGRSVSSPSEFTSHVGELERVAIKGETQDEPQVYKGGDIDVELSGRIAKLEM
jgi:hypothetical protein